jgi:hypothetical protein
MSNMERAEMSIYLMRNKLTAILSFIVLALLASCAKEGPIGPQGFTGPSFTGSIGGHVSFYDQYGSLVTANLNKTQLILEGSTTVLSASIYPDTTGFYTFTPVSTGNYTITAANTPAYAYTILNGIQFVSGIINVDVKLSEIPVFASTAFTADTITNNDSLNISFAPDARLRNCIVFVYNNISSADTITNTLYLLSYKKAIAANATSTSLLVPAQDLYNVGFQPGSMVYYAEFSYVINDVSAYEDTVSGKKVYYAISNPKLDSAIVP